jgi:hypothetical protein
MALPFAALVLCMLAVFRDYGRIDEAWMAHRFRAARIGTMAEAPLPPIAVLTNLQALLGFMRIEPQAATPPAELDRMRQVAERYPSPGGLFRYAWAQALNGNSEEAVRMLVVLCKVHSDTQCDGAKEAWRAKAQGEHSFAAAMWPASP